MEELGVSLSLYNISTYLVWASPHPGGLSIAGHSRGNARVHYCVLQEEKTETLVSHGLLGIWKSVCHFHHILLVKAVREPIHIHGEGTQALTSDGRNVKECVSVFKFSHLTIKSQPVKSIALLIVGKQRG